MEIEAVGRELTLLFELGPSGGRVKVVADQIYETLVDSFGPGIWVNTYATKQLAIAPEIMRHKLKLEAIDAYHGGERVRTSFRLRGIGSAGLPPQGMQEGR